ncbi:conjugative transposon protein TraN [Hymenobacter sp. UV11]|uniref:conjugative transposon protein TraN n=1 Tax=Hymenobacter sp. UV11 TaxID=1849735 RepID=UPI001061F22C|nr:conjugative transposon protein TraN [Hymenobacter sp. UV11]TDN39857.1 conjugative transposon protein TraN [Hymenobacter sp. UV11]TFZ63219.1 conjugative transposon protein TraN [Hymenobacter sp. UV11]
MKITPTLALALAFTALRPTGAVAQKPAAQTMANTTAASKLATVNLFVSDVKTTHLVFPQPVTYVDLGSSGIIAAKATGSENIVRVKAATSGFGETNMTVLTAGGKLYTFVVNYQRSPKMLGIDLGGLNDAGEPTKLPTTPLYVSDQKTSHLVFPFPVTYVDLGNPGIIASKATGAENIVRVKAASSTFPEANMTVLTSGGKLYMFLVSYQHDPKVLSLDMGAAAGEGSGEATASTGGAILSNSPIPQGSLDAYSVEALSRGGTSASESANQLSLRSGAVGYRQETLFFPLHIANKSNVTYDVDFVKFYIQDKQVAKRTAEQAIEINPIYVFNGAKKKIDAKGTLEQVYIFKKFTIPEQKQLIIELYEKGGGRNIKLKLSNSDLLKAKTFK